jgi:hypothetical protein
MPNNKSRVHVATRSSFARWVLSSRTRTQRLMLVLSMGFLAVALVVCLLAPHTTSIVGGIVEIVRAAHPRRGDAPGGSAGTGELPRAA